MFLTRTHTFPVHHNPLDLHRVLDWDQKGIQGHNEHLGEQTCIIIIIIINVIIINLLITIITLVGVVPIMAPLVPLV